MSHISPQVHQIELPEIQVSRIAVDSSGQFLALAGSRDVTVLAFDVPSQLHAFPLNSRSEPAGLSWHPDNPGQLAVVRHTRCELLSWDPTEGRLSICRGLGGYVRPITSFDWSPFHPYLLATSSADQFRAICVWDVRDLTRPARAIESLSAPTLIKWNRAIQGKFACSHRNEIRLWDLRTNVPEQYLTELSGAAVLEFDWRPTEQSELCAAYRGGQLHVWDWANPDKPSCSMQLSPGMANIVSYSPPGDHVITLPEPAHWSHFGLGTWNAVGLQKSTRGLWVSDGARNITLQPRPIDPVVRAFAWRKTNGVDSRSQIESDECFIQDADEQCGLESPLNECSIQLVTWSSDHQIRLYPVQCSLTSTAIEHLSRVSSNNTSSTRPISQSSGVPEFVGPVCNLRTVSPRLRSPSVSRTKQLWDSSAMTSTAAFAITTASVVSTAIASPLEPRPHSIRRLQSSTVPSSKYKAADQHSSCSVREDDIHLRLAAARWASSGPSLQSQTAEIRDRAYSVEDNGYQILAQELSLLSPRAGQYKLEEIDLINRNAKLMVFYCRRKHFHHYTVCAVSTSGDRDRRNSADLDESGDLETLLLPVNDLLPSIDAFSRTEPWRPVERSKSSEELYNLIGDEVVNRDATSENRNQEFQSGSVSIVDNQLSRCVQPAITGLTVQTSSLPESYGMEFTMPLSGTVALSVEFPSTYPATVPVFTVTDHEPPLPNEVIQRLKEVLHSTASELTHTSRGCMEPCVRKAVDFLQNVTAFQLTNSETRCGLATIGRTDCTSTTVHPGRTGTHVPGDVFENHPNDIPARLQQNGGLRCPFPRLCGVHFSPNGRLVTFGLSKGRWNAIVASGLITADAGNTDASAAPLLTGLHKHSFLSRSFHEYCQIRQLLLKSIHTRRLSENPTVITESKPGDRLVEGNNVPGEEEEADRTVVDRVSGELQLKEIIQELVQGSINADKIAKVSSLANNQQFPFSREQRYCRTETKSTSDKDTTSEISRQTVTGTHMDQSGLMQSTLPDCRSLVQLYDLTDWIVDTRLIHQYSLKNENLHEMCVHNYIVSLTTGRKDLIRFWQYAIVLSASFTPHSSDCGAIPPWPLQPMGWPLFHEWISYFEKISDVQNAVMAIFVLQGLDAMYKAQLHTPLPSTNSILELSYFQERTTLQQELNSGQMCKRPSEPGRASNAGAFDVSPSNTTVSFTLDASYDMPGDEEPSVTVSATMDSNAVVRDRFRDQVSHPIIWGGSKTFTQNQSSVERYDRDMRLVPIDQVRRFAHCVAMYADILYASGSFLRHARLLRTWTWGLRSKAQTQSSQLLLGGFPTAAEDMPWPLGVTEALLLPACPVCCKPTVPLSQNHAVQSQIQRIDCCHCKCDSSMFNAADPGSDSMDRRFLSNLQCTICRTRVRGLVFLCERCNHGGHIDHLSQWFYDPAPPNQPRQCPALSCQCYCVAPNPIKRATVFVS